MAITYFDDSLSSFSLQQKATGRITEETTAPGPYYGTKITQFSCQQNDNGTFAGTKTTAKRCEFYLPTATAGSTNGATQWWAFTIVGVSGTIPTNGHSMRFQWHGPNGTGQPQVVLNTLDGYLNCRLWDAGTNKETNYPAVNSTGTKITFANSTPYHVLHRIVHTTDSDDGLVEWWCNGTKFVEQKIQTIYTQTTSGGSITGTELRNYPKWGFYGSNDAGTVVTRVDGIRRGSSDETFASMIADFPVGSGYTGSTGGGGSGGTTTLSVAFLSPSSGATITGLSNWRASASAAANVKFYVDDVHVLTETASPYGDTAGFWDSTTVADGSRVLKVVATSSSGSTVEATRTVTVDNVSAPPANPDSPPADDRYRKSNRGKAAGSKIAGTKTAGTKITPSEQEDDAESASFGTTSVLDPFIRANEGPPPSSSWTTGIYSTDGGLKVVSNECQGDTSTGNSGYWDVATFGPDCEAYVTLNNKGNDGSWCYVWARIQNVDTAAPSGYAARFDASVNTDTLRLYRVDSGVLTQIGSTYSLEFSVNDRFGIKCQGTTISVWRSPQSGDWTQVISTTDETYQAPGYIGLQSRGATQDFKDFGGGTLGTALAAPEIAPFDPVHPIYTPIPSSVTNDPSSASIITGLGATGTAYGCFIDTDGDSPPVYIGASTDPLWTLTVADAAFTGLSFEIRAPAGIAPGVGTDAPLVILDKSSAQYGNFPVEYRMFQAVVDAGSRTITAAVAGIGPYHNDGRLYSGSRALGQAEIVGRNTGSGNSYTVGMVRPHEIVAGDINHALRAAVGFTATTYRWPADRSDGVGTYPTQIEMGSRLYLPSSVNMTTIDAAIDAYVDADASAMNALARAAAKTLVRAMRDYGICVLDSRTAGAGGFNFYFEGDDTANWETSMGPRNAASSWNHIGRCLRDCVPWSSMAIAAASTFTEF